MEQGLAKGAFSIADVGDIIPGSVMVHDMQVLQVSYMNKMGCEQLNHSLEQINEMGEAYFDTFMHPEETSRIIPAIANYFQSEGNSRPYSFFQQVRTGSKMAFDWYYTTCKFLSDDAGNASAKLMLISNQVSGMGLMVSKVTKLLGEQAYVTKHYKKFALLTRREKEIISLLAEGKTTNDIAALLYISHHTVSTHRKNIYSKLELATFSQLLQFAAAFDLVK
ncbi:hypothetical protein BUE76_19190 [Cnuella takakiae]|nr:hypothetical protein BUE76_19190 [Cnuella takakiae]